MQRRRFLSVSAGLPLLAAVGPSATPASAGRGSDFGPWLEIQSHHLLWNVGEISRRVQGRPIWAVVKSNAYGHGLVETSLFLASLEQIRGLAVFHPEEAFRLREAGIQKPILVLGPASDRELEELVRLHVRPCLYEERGALLERLAGELQRPVPVHLYVDTGMGRMGVPDHGVLPLVESLLGRKGIRLEGAMTVFTEDEAFDREQLGRFHKVLGELRKRGAGPLHAHAASSAAVFHFPEAYLDGVRPGIALYGGYPDARAERQGELSLKPVMSLKVRVMQVKELRAGDSLQYHRAYVAKEPVWIATLPLGHSHGWPAQAAGKCRVKIGGKEYPVVASVTSNHTLVEIGERPEVEVGQEVLCFGADQDGGIDPHRVARETGLSVYHLFMHMQADLPRRWVQP